VFQRLIHLHIITNNDFQMPVLPAGHRIETVTHMWRMSGLVEKTALRSEVREFCDQYPVYRLSDYPLERNAEGLAG